VLRVCDLKNATLGVVGNEDLAIAVGIVFVLGSYVTIRSENDKAPVGADVAHVGGEANRA
jgi:hypothetical protein